mgnify:FL=1
MAAQKNSKAPKKQGPDWRWIFTIFFITVLISAVMSLISTNLLSSATLGVSFVILICIIAIGIVFDIIGVAVTAADEKPFHSMAARKVPGSQEAIRLLRNAERVSSICNDVVGDICGVVSGSASATIAVQVMQHFTFSAKQVIPLVMSAMVAGLTVGGKAIGKTFAVHSCTNIVYGVGKLLYWIHHPSELFHKDR